VIENILAEWDTLAMIPTSDGKPLNAIFRSAVGQLIQSFFIVSPLLDPDVLALCISGFLEILFAPINAV